LDPHFVQSYWFAAFIVGQERRDPKKAAELIQRGIAANQDNWYIPFIAGINQYLFAGNELAASKYYRMASKYPDAPPWLGRQAEILQAKIPSSIKEINTWHIIYQSNPSPIVKERAKHKLIELWVKVYKSAPPGAAKDRAKGELAKFGVEMQ